MRPCPSTLISSNKSLRLLSQTLGVRSHLPKKTGAQMTSSTGEKANDWLMLDLSTGEEIVDWPAPFVRTLCSEYRARNIVE